MANACTAHGAVFSDGGPVDTEIAAHDAILVIAELEPVGLHWVAFGAEHDCGYGAYDMAFILVIFETVKDPEEQVHPMAVHQQ
jgi:hypothetical protein